jgi:5-methylcytosine-specific restriction endonuclease McrA
MNLKSKSNPELLSTLKLQVENERKLLMEILYSLQEVEARNLHLEMGYPDLYTFAMKELSYSSGAAYRRISAMRLLKSVPEIASKLESGELGLENASQAQSYFRKEDQARREQGLEKLSLNEKREVVSELLNKSTREGLRLLTERAPDITTPAEKLKALPDQKTMIQFVASSELMDKLEELKHLLAHQNFEGRMDILIEKLADIALKKLRPASSPAPGMIATGRKVATRSQTDALKLNPMRTKKLRSRYIPAQIRKQVLLRDQSGCTYQDPKTGRVCGARHGLQLDHLTPFSWGGEHSVDNLALRCGAHNRFRAEQMRLM